MSSYATAFVDIKSELYSFTYAFADVQNLTSASSHISKPPHKSRLPVHLRRSWLRLVSYPHANPAWDVIPSPLLVVSVTGTRLIPPRASPRDVDAWPPAWVRAGNWFRSPTSIHHSPAATQFPGVESRLLPGLVTDWWPTEEARYIGRAVWRDKGLGNISISLQIARGRYCHVYVDLNTTGWIKWYIICVKFCLLQSGLMMKSSLCFLHIYVNKCASKFKNVILNLKSWHLPTSFDSSTFFAVTTNP